jgi:2-polyprenyl-3-methyl-5-hydroxy-6-metoxy-1,4-benzoquinol methylase
MIQKNAQAMAVHSPQSYGLARFLCPTRLRAFRSLFGATDRVSFLDIGCATRSATKTKQWLPNAVYTGVDITDAVLTPEDREAIDRFVLVSEEDTTYSALADGTYDVVMMAHVLEHMKDPKACVRSLLRKIKPGGYIYMAFPSRESLAFPSAKGTLNYFDDKTHISIIDFVEMSQLLLDEGFEVQRAGKSADLPRFLIGLLLYPIAHLRRLFTNELDGRGLWFVYGFEDMVLARKPTSRE